MVLPGDRSIRCLPYQLSMIIYVAIMNKGSIPERKPEKRLPHPRKAVGAQIIHYQNEQIVTKKSGLFLFFSFHQNNQERKISSHKSCLR
uniref:Uncharacterized protein n=1 Tax=Onchocerca volvulus TaxID=6282 RepID=A0A8R1XMD7_ONCVO